MAKVARSYHPVFRSVELKSLESYHALYLAGKSRFVHAEVQVITHYELNPIACRPRVIGASKMACFLCDSFVRAHGWFCLSKAHRVLYDQWTIPDLKDYTPSSRDRLRKALVTVNSEVKKQLSRPSTNRFPVQSAANSVIASIRDASRSTRRGLGNETDHEFPQNDAASTIARKKGETILGREKQSPGDNEKDPAARTPPKGVMVEDIEEAAVSDASRPMTNVQTTSAGLRNDGEVVQTESEGTAVLKDDALNDITDTQSPEPRLHTSVARSRKRTAPTDGASSRHRTTKELRNGKMAKDKGANEEIVHLVKRESRRRAHYKRQGMAGKPNLDRTKPSRKSQEGPGRRRRSRHGLRDLFCSFGLFWRNLLCCSDDFQSEILYVKDKGQKKKK